jgi:hypothetical protein
MHRTFAVLVTLSLLTLVPPARAEQPGPTIDDDIAILRALHADRCGDGNSPLIITDRPIGLATDVGMRRPRKEFGIEMISRAPHGTFWPLVELCPQVRVVNHLRLERFLDGPGQLPKDYAGFEREYGVNSYEQVSLPAYSADGLRAVVITEYVCPMCGQGETLLFVKFAGHWKLVDSRTDWMS